MLDLAISSGVSYCGPVHTDVMPVTEVQEVFASELCAVVSDDDVGYPELVDYVGEEEDSLLGSDVCDGSSLDPHGALVDGNQQVVVSSHCPLEGTHEVEAPVDTIFGHVPRDQQSIDRQVEQE